MGSRFRFDPIAILTLRDVRSFIRASSARGGVVFFSLLYGLGAAFSGGMILIASIPGGYTVTWLWASGNGSYFWNYPGLLVVAPWGVISAPFFPTLTMVLSAVGVGYGMTVAFLLTVQLLHNRRQGTGGATATSSIAGLTPAMITLVTLGACCSTTAAASAGVGVVASAAGTTADNLLINNWFLGVFQVAIVWIALVAQELLLIVYAGLFEKGATERPVAPLPRLNGRTVLAGAFRGLLLVSGLLWSLSMVAEWTTVSPWTAGPGLWFQWLVQHQLVALVAISAALFPTGTWEVLSAGARRLPYVLSGVFLVAGLSLLWSPPPLPAWGLDGMLNQALYALGAPASWGAVSTGGLDPLALAVRWSLEYGLMAAFALSIPLGRDRLFGLIRWAPFAAPTRPVSSAIATPSPATGAAPAVEPMSNSPSASVPGP